MNYVLIFVLGFFGYGALETIWRGHTHWTMMLCGGICLNMIYFLHSFSNAVPIYLLCLVSALFITVTELAVGCIVNIRLKMNMWNFSDLFLNFKGQICPTYSLLWFALSILAFKFCDYFPLK